MIHSVFHPAQSKDAPQEYIIEMPNNFKIFIYQEEYNKLMDVLKNNNKLLN